MRKFALLATAATLSACGGGGGGGGPLNSGGTVAPPTAVGGGTQTPSGGGGGHSFVEPKVEVSYQAVGASHSFEYKVMQEITPAVAAVPAKPEVPATATTPAVPATPAVAATPEIIGDRYRNGSELYRGNASTARNSAIQITYNPRDAIFSLVVSDPLAGVSNENRFQDPIHRTDFGGLREPQEGTPELGLPGINYLQVLNASAGVVDKAGYRLDLSTFFYQKPGTTTKYVALAGYLRNAVSISPSPDPQNPGLIYTYDLQRSAFAYGERARDQDVPKSGTGTYTGPMVGTMVFNDLADVDRNSSTYMQWLEGTSQLRVDFGGSRFDLDLNGRVSAPNNNDGTSDAYSVRSGATFSAAGSGRIDLVLQGGFLGEFQRASFTNPNGRRLDVSIAGSSVNGAFFGPNAEEVGGGFRIVGGRPDERIDIHGAFVGKK